MQSDASYTGFPKTRWTLIEELQTADPDRIAKAQAVLCETYWPCVYSFYRAKGHSRQNAQDLVQAFFTTVVLQRELFTKADRSRGHLRALLRTALRNFEIEEHRKENRSVRKFTIQESSFQHEDALLDSLSAESAPETFDQRWALAIVADARDQCERHFKEKKKQDHWRLFRHRVLDPATMSTTPLPLREIHADYGFDTEKSAAAAVQTVKRRFAQFLKEMTADDPEMAAMVGVS